MKTILVPTDFSKEADYAIDVARILARKMGASLTLIHVIQFFFDIDYTSAADLPEESKKQLIAEKEKVEGQLQELIKQKSFGRVEVKPLVTTDSVSADISEIIIRQKADLIVLGTKGDSGLHEIVIGSNAEKIVRYAHCPVLTVHTKVENFKLQHIVFPTDFDERADKLLYILKSWQQVFSSTIHVLYVNTDGKHNSFLGIESRMKKFLAKHKDVKLVPAIVDARSEREGIEHYAAKINADLIAMYTHGRKGLAHLLSGSIAEKMVNRTSIPVLTYNIHSPEIIFL